MKLQEIAERLGCQLEGDGEIDIRGVAGIERAERGDLTFFANRKYASQLKTTTASAVIQGERDELDVAHGVAPLVTLIVGALTRLITAAGSVSAPDSAWATRTRTLLTTAFAGRTDAGFVW